MKSLIYSLMIFFTINVNAQIEESKKNLLDSTIIKIDENVVSRHINYFDESQTLKFWIAIDYDSSKKKTEVEYNSAGKLISEIYSESQPNLEEYINKSRVIYSYEGSVFYETTFNWNETEEDWVGDQKIVTYSNQNEMVDSIVELNWNRSNKNWYRYRKEQLQYNSQGQVVETQEFYNNSNSNSLNLIGKEEYEYNKLNQLEIKNHYTWNTDSSIWKNDNYYTTFEYDANGNNTNIKYFQNNELMSEYVYAFDSLNNELSQEDRIYDESTESWLIEYQELIVYDYTKEAKNDELGFGFSKSESESTHRIVYMELIYPIANETFKVNLYYSDRIVLETKGEIAKTSSFDFFPNPTKNSVNFEEQVHTLTIQDLTGRIIIQSQYPSKSFDVSALENGSYILLLETNNGLVSEKLLISK